MTCPYFQPVSPLDSGGWNPSPRQPLGDSWSGFCVALPSGSYAPPEEVQRELCNCGYARGRCAYFPAESQTDAVRFAPSGPADNGQQKIIYIFERDHAPVAFGEFRVAEHNAAVVAQAAAFREALRKGNGSTAALDGFIHVLDVPLIDQ